MTKRHLQQIYSANFDDEVIAILKKNRLGLDRSKVARSKTLTAELLAGLFERRYCAIHIPNYCEPNIAQRAGQWILDNSRIVTWYIPDRRTGMKTDMSYGIGIPRQVAGQSKEAGRQYVREAMSSIRKVRRAFAPNLSPMDRLRLELEEVWSGGVGIEPFLGGNGFVGLVRIMKPEGLFKGIAGVKGVCHVDAGVSGKTFSANIYLKVPKSGGELRIWNIPLDKRTAQNPTYTLINRYRTFDADIQEVIHDLLPKPLVIRPKEGDLVILDASRPHAVAGFESGHRISVQSFVRYKGAGNRLGIDS